MLRLRHLTLFVVVTAIPASNVLGQGTATAPSTAHTIDSSTDTVWMGGPNDPINGPSPQPIDLDPTGAPWRKSINAGNNGYGGQAIQIRETIQNVGTEPWTDWHEINAEIGSHSIFWVGVSDVRINGSSISYTATISGTTLDLDNFSQPVLPGDTLEIDKEFDSVLDLFVPQGTLVASILQYPTTIPEPSTAALLVAAAVGILSVSERRR